MSAISLLAATLAGPLGAHAGEEAQTAYQKAQDPAYVAGRLFPLLDLNQPALHQVRDRYRAGDHEGALTAYRDVVVDRLSKQNLGPVGSWGGGASRPQELLEGYVRISRHAGGVSYNFIGKPGEVQWFRSEVDEVIGQPADIDADVRASSDRDFATHLSAMGWTSRLVDAFTRGWLVENPKMPIYLQHWAAFWEDFMLRHKPGFAALHNRDQYNSIGASQHAGLYIGWRLNYCLTGLSLACSAAPEETKRALSGTTLGNILVGIIEEHVERLVAHGRYPGTPNQQWEANMGILRAVMALPDARRVDEWETFVGRKISLYINSGSALLDGSDMEQSFNYNRALLAGGKEVLKLMQPTGRNPEWLEQLRDVSTLRYRFLESLVRPTGVLQRSLLPGADKQAYGDAVQQHKRPADLLDDPLVDQIRDHLYDGGPEPGFTSIAFPYGGYFVQRSGWTGDAYHLFFKTSRPGTGHRSQDCNSIQVTAFGRTILIDSGPDNYTHEFCNDYMPSSFAHNTVVVDGQTQLRGSRAGFDYTQPIPCLWHTSANFDLAEGVFSQGYGEAENRVDGVQHNRQVFFLRNHGLWIVVDRLLAESGHQYDQIWNFGHHYAEHQLKLDDTTRRVTTLDPDGPNITLHHFSKLDLAYSKYYGQKEPAVRGWYKPIFRSPPVPAVDVHAGWTGEGRQLLVTLIEPRRRQESHIRTLHAAGGADADGFELQLEDGTSMSFQASLDAAPLAAGPVSIIGRALLVVRCGDQISRGIVIDCTQFSLGGEPQPLRSKYAEFEIRDGVIDAVEIKAPQLFRWVQTDKGLVPAYQR